MPHIACRFGAQGCTSSPGQPELALSWLGPGAAVKVTVVTFTGAPLRLASAERVWPRPPGTRLRACEAMSKVRGPVRCRARTWMAYRW